MTLVLVIPALFFVSGLLAMIRNEAKVARRDEGALPLFSSLRKAIGRGRQGAQKMGL